MAFIRMFLFAMALVFASANQCTDGGTETCAEKGSTMIQKIALTKSKLEDSTSANKTGRVDVTILSVYHGRTGSWFGGGAYSQIISNTFSFSGGPGTGSAFRAGSCSAASWTPTKTKLTGEKIRGGFVQTKGSDRMGVYTSEEVGGPVKYRKFNPTFGSYTPFSTVSVDNPPEFGANNNFRATGCTFPCGRRTKLVADAVGSGENFDSGVLSLQDDEFSHVNMDTGAVTKACSYPGIAETLPIDGKEYKRTFTGEVYAANMPSKKAVVVGKNYRDSDKPNELYLLDTDHSGGVCPHRSWTLHEGDWFCGIAVDQAREKAYALVERHEGAQTAECHSPSQMSIYEISLEGTGVLQGEKIYDLPDFGHSGRVLYGRATMFLQSKSIWFLQFGYVVYPIEVAANPDQMPSAEELQDRSFECDIKDLFGTELPPTIWAEGQ